MSKHSTSDSDDCISETHGEPKAKRRKYVEFEPVRICSISGVKDIDNKVLLAQHYKLCERYRYKEKQRQLLERRVEELERRQAKDDEVSCIINRYWNRLDENVQLIIQRFDVDTMVDFDTHESDSNDGRSNFLTIMSNWGIEEIDEKFSQRVEFTQRALSKLVQVFGRISDKNQRLIGLISSEKENHLESGDISPNNGIGEELRAHAASVLIENGRLQQIVEKLQAENHRLKLQVTGCEDRVHLAESRIERLSNEIEDVRFELDKALRRCEKLDYRLAEYVRKEQTLQVVAEEKSIKENGVDEELTNVSKTKLNELQQQLDLQTELAANRLIEIQEMTERNKTMAADLERSQMDLKYFSGDVVKSSADYLALQAQYSALFDDCKLLRNEIEELRQKTAILTQSHAKQIESMKHDETAAQERMQETVLELDQQLNQVRKEYDALCVEFEQSNAANEQAGPINEHALSLMNTFSTQNTQLRMDVSRYKRRWNEAARNLAKCQKELAMERKINNDKYLIIKLDDSRNGSRKSHNSREDEPAAASVGCDVKPTTSETEDRKPLTSGILNGSDGSSDANCVSGSSNVDTETKVESTDASISTAILDDAKPTCSSAYEKRLKLERNCAIEKLREMARVERREKHKFYTDEAKRKIHSLEEQCEKLRKELANAKQEEDGLMSELDSTGQACDEMQEQNRKLVLQLREKDEANLKLMADRIRVNQLLKKMKEERDTQEAKSTAVDNLLAAKMLLIKKLEEKERALVENRSTLEQELRLRDQANDSLRRKAAESTQSANDMRLRLDKLTSQFSELQENIAKKASSYEVMVMKTKRLEEDKSKLKRKLERAKRMEKFDNADEVLKEENRLLKETLTCPSCKVNTKNALLTKCYHVFCFQCLKLRYDTRRRKCPKCNAAFGANDFRRLYIE